MEQPILKIESVSKTYRLGTFGSGTLAGDYLAWMAKRRGEPNPNIRIGQEWRLKNRRFDALDDVSFSVEPGCRLGIIGANGAGKSTLLKLISRITAPSRGSIYLNGRVASMLEVGTGFSPELTGRENIYLNGAILGMQKTTIDGKLQGIIEFSDCAEFIDTPIKRYSSGMKVRLGFAVAAHLDNEIMLMDEVLAVGDVTFQQKCIDKMNEISLDSGRTIIYVSHMMHTVRELCERCIVLDHGKIVFDGEVDDAIQIYMQNNASGAKEYSFTDEPRLFLRRREVRAASLHALRFLNSDTLVFDKDETVDVEIEWECVEPFDNARFYFAVKYSNGDAVGSVISGKISAKKPGHYVSRLSFAFKGLRKGSYYFHAAMVQEDLRDRRILDYPNINIPIEVNETTDTATWQHNIWGHLALDEATIEETRMIEKVET